jgi:hypothetical protein
MYREMIQARALYQYTLLILLSWLLLFLLPFFVQEIELGLSQIVLAGGTENMTQAPYAVRDIRFGTRFGQDLKVSCSFCKPRIDMHD